MPPSSVEVSRSPARPRARRILRALAQNFGLVLAWVVLVVAVIVYCIIYFAQQGVLPGNFEATSTINNTMPLVLTALGQTIVILTRGLDLSVGGIIDLTNALAALNFADNPGTMILWTVLILLTGAVLGLINGALVAIGRLQPIVVTIATLSIYQGLAIMVLPQPGGAIPPAFTSILVNDSGPWAGLYCVGFALLWMALRRSRLGVALYAVATIRPPPPRTASRSSGPACLPIR